MSQPAAYQQPAAARRPNRGWIASIGATAAVAVVTLGGYAFGGPLPWGGGLFLGDRVPVAGDVTIQLGEGWEVTGPFEGSVTGIQLQGPGGNALVGVSASGGTPGDLASSYFNDTLAAEATEISPTETVFIEMEIGQAAYFRYWGRFEGIGTPLEGGVYAIVTTSGVPIVFDGWAPEGWLAAFEQLFFAMASSIEGG